jgi:hypothetical protein
MGKIPAQGPVRAQMTERPEMGGADDGGEDDIGADWMRGWRHGSGGRAPMQVIINIGPDSRVDVEEPRAGRAGIGPMRAHMMMGGKAHDHATADGMAARLGYLRNELRLTLEQQPAWNRFASTVLAGVVRDAVARMRPASEAAGQGQSPLEHRLAMHEATLTAPGGGPGRTWRAAGLAAALNDAQRRTLEEHADAFVPGLSQAQDSMYW